MTISLHGYDTQIQLSQEELFEISQEITRLYAPIPERDFIEAVYSDKLYKPNHLVSSNSHETKSIVHQSRNSMTSLSTKELQDISESISSRFAPVARSEPVSELTLLPVDPYHLYAYWSINPEQKQKDTDNGFDNPLILRIYWRPDEITATTTSHLWFDLALHERQSRQKIRLPVSGTAYSASVGRLQADDHLWVIAESNIIRVPCDTSTPVTNSRHRPLQTIQIQPPDAISRAFLPSITTPYADTAYTDDSIIFEPMTRHWNNETFVFKMPSQTYEHAGIEPCCSDEFYFFSQLQHMLSEHAKGINQHIIFKNITNNAMFLNGKHASGLGI